MGEIKRRRPSVRGDAQKSFYRESYPGNADPGNTLGGVSNARESAVGEIKGTACDERPPISHSNDHAFVRGGVGHSQAGAERERAMGSSEAVSVEATAISSALTMKTVAVAVETGMDARRSRLRCKRCKGT